MSALSIGDRLLQETHRIEVPWTLDPDVWCDEVRTVCGGLDVSNFEDVFDLDGGCGPCVVLLR